MATSTQARGVVVDTARSPHARLRPVPVDAVTIEDTFWAPRMRINRERTIPSQERMLWETGRMANFQRVAGTFDGPFQGRYYNDSDVYKWLEAAAWLLAADPDPALARQVDEAIAVIAAAQQPDGYLNTYFAVERAGERWANHDLHEMYCAGHLFQAAVAHHRATGSRRLLDVAIRFADHLDATFGPPEQGKRVGTDGHPEVEMALVELGRETGERRYLDLARFLLDARGHGLLGRAYDRYGPEYHQDHRPFRDLDEIVGHAVRAVYLNAGAADLYAETGEAALGAALHRLWADMTGRKMYVSGGIGSRYEGEAFGERFELPNHLAYTETCAAIGSAMWTWRMLLLEGEARYADLIEVTLMNAMLAGVSLDGERYFYQNPLADEGFHRRQPWFECACCPPNVARVLASLPGYVYTTSDDAIWVHLYAEGTARIARQGGREVGLRQRTGYPWDGEIGIEVDGEGEFTLRLRVPGWCEGAALAVNGVAEPAPVSGAYAEVRRRWQPGDVVRLSLPMPARLVACHPRVAENAGRVAIMRGPLLYCVEAADHPGVDIRDVSLPAGIAFHGELRPDLLGGVVTLTGTAMLAPPDPAWEERLYQALPVRESAVAPEPVAITAIPYYAWANRAAGPMRVWLSLRAGPA